ncbi:MAG TPA: CopD family protein [Thiolinea sp.]|nr:CopD family protein [Thiolinea sp.]
MAYLWIKALHVAFMVTWFAGLFYLPRLYVYHAMPENRPSFALFMVMERRLFGIMTLGAGLTLLFGLILLFMNPALLGRGWFHAKLTLLLGLGVYHYCCYRLMVAFREARNTRSHRWFRVFNEVPALALLLIVPLAMLKAF